MTKCTFHKFGPSGTVEKFDGLCVLPLNIINEKIYVFLWFWFIILTVITGMQVIYRFVLVLCLLKYSVFHNSIPPSFFSGNHDNHKN